jgi:hypothetical protein
MTDPHDPRTSSPLAATRRDVLEPDGAERPPPPLPPLPGRRASRPPRRPRPALAPPPTSTRRSRPPDPEDPTGDDPVATGDDLDPLGAGTPDVDGVPRSRRSFRRSTGPARSWFRIAAAAAFALALGLAAYGAVRPRGANTSALGLVAIPLLAVLVHQLVRRTAAREPRFDLLGIMMLGLGLRCIGAFLRFTAPVDALIYHQEGSRIAPALRGLDFGVDTGRPIPGTGGIRYVSGLIHAFVIDDMFVTFMVFTLLSFIGVFLCYTAFVRAVPEGDHRRYALLIFLWPALVYWPSSIGKEAWMIFGLGITSWGVARIVTGRAGIGLAVTVAGLATLSFVRPHVALMAVVGLAVALLARPKSRSTFRLTGRVVLVVVILVGGSIIVGRTAEVLKIDLTGAESITTALVETQEQTDQGGARFDSAVVRTPLDYPIAFATVWFRPLPIEVSDATGLLSAAENTALLILVAISWRRLLALPRNLLRLPYATYAAAYSLVFVYAFSVIANFGILARQRTQGLVLFFVLLCVTIDRAAPTPLPGRERAHRERPTRRLAREPEPPAAFDRSPERDADRTRPLANP